MSVVAPGFHISPQDGIHAGLVAGALLPEPVNNIGIEPNGQLRLGFLRRHPDFGLPEKIAPQLGDIGIVDILIRDRFDLLKPFSLSHGKERGVRGSGSKIAFDCISSTKPAP